jgi:bifunctional DNA-binding transcriptional regulator/antitoxin component of YhaV-PrlF toxin-antitoxin module
MNNYHVREMDTITVTEKGQATFPAKWRREVGLLRGGPCDVRILNDGRKSLLITPRAQKRRGTTGPRLLAHLKKQTAAFPPIERHALPFK